MDELVSLTCKTCGSPLSRPEPGEHFVVCKFCGTTHDLTSPPPDPPPSKPIAHSQSRFSPVPDFTPDLDLPERKNLLSPILGGVIVLGLAGAAFVFVSNTLHPKKGTAHFEAGDLASAFATDISLVSGDQTLKVGPLPSSMDLDLTRKWTLVAKKHGYVDMNKPIAFDEGSADQTFRVELLPVPCAPDGSNGCLPKAVVQQFVNDQAPKIRYCFANEMGMTSFPMQVDESGHVLNPPVTLPPGFGTKEDKFQDTCLDLALSKWVLPKAANPTNFVVMFQYNSDVSLSAAVSY